MKDYNYLKFKIRKITAAKASELDELLNDSTLMAELERICNKSNADLPTYIQFLMEQKVPGSPSLPDLARMIVTKAKKDRPGMFED